MSKDDEQLESRSRRCYAVFSQEAMLYTAQADVYMLATGDENELQGEILTERLG